MPALPQEIQDAESGETVLLDLEIAFLPLGGDAGLGLEYNGNLYRVVSPANEIIWIGQDLKSALQAIIDNMNGEEYYISI